MNAAFKLNEQVVHPNHGIGRIGRTQVERVAGRTGRFLVVAFPRPMLMLRIPVDKLEHSGLRRISSAHEMRAALSALSDTPLVPHGPWARWAAEFGRKLNSGQPRLLAEILRDLNHRQHTGWASLLYREALSRLAEELAIVDGVDVDEAEAMIADLVGPDDSADRKKKKKKRN